MKSIGADYWTVEVSDCKRYECFVNMAKVVAKLIYIELIDILLLQVYAWEASKLVANVVAPSFGRLSEPL